MRRVGVSPRQEDFQGKPHPYRINDWLFTVGERMNVYTGAADPTADEVPENQWIVYHNTTAGEVRIWTNIAGAVLKSAAFT